VSIDTSNSSFEIDEFLKFTRLKLTGTTKIKHGVGLSQIIPPCRFLYPVVKETHTQICLSLREEKKGVARFRPVVPVVLKPRLTTHEVHSSIEDRYPFLRVFLSRESDVTKIATALGEDPIMRKMMIKSIDRLALKHRSTLRSVQVDTRPLTVNDLIGRAELLKELEGLDVDTLLFGLLDMEPSEEFTDFELNPTDDPEYLINVDQTRFLLHPYVTTFLTNAFKKVTLPGFLATLKIYFEFLCSPDNAYEAFDPDYQVGSLSPRSVEEVSDAGFSVFTERLRQEKVPELRTTRTIQDLDWDDL
jgi:hypothetical protein